MKQGRASREGMMGGKREPSARGIPPVFTSRLGTMQGNHATEADGLPNIRNPMHTRGFNAPAPSSQKTHKGGSQGRY